MSDASTEGPGAVKRLRATLLLSAEEKRHGDRFILGLYVLINGAIAIGSLSALAAITHQAFVFPSLGPTAFILFFSAMSVQAAPRNVFLGHLVGVLAGALALAIFGLTTAPPDLDLVTWPRAGALTLAMCLTGALLIWLGIAHAPATATTLIVAFGLLHTASQLLVLMLGVVLLLVQALVINRLAGVPHPLWKPVGSSPPG